MQHFINKTHLFFDIDDTLWDFRFNARIGLQQVYDSYGLNRWYDSFKQYYDVYTEKNHLLWAAYGRGEISKAFLSYERFAYPLRLCNAEPLCDIEGMGHDFLEFTSQQCRLVDGALTLLEYLRGHYVLGVISNGFSQVQHRKLFSSGLSPYFDYVVLSEDVGALKPNALIFDYALRLSGATRDSVVMVGDNWSTDIIGAVSCGWDAIFFDRLNDVLSPLLEHVVVVHSLDEVRCLL